MLQIYVNISWSAPCFLWMKKSRLVLYITFDRSIWMCTSTIQTKSMGLSCLLAMTQAFSIVYFLKSMLRIFFGGRLGLHFWNKNEKAEKFFKRKSKGSHPKIIEYKKTLDLKEGGGQFENLTIEQLKLGHLGHELECPNFCLMFSILNIFLSEFP